MPEENPAPTPAPEPTPTVTPEPATPAPAPAAPTPVAAPATPTAPKKSKTGLIVGICAVATIAIIGTVVAIILINNNKPKEPTVNDILNGIFKTDDSQGSNNNDSNIDWGSLFNDDDNDNDDSGIDWSKLLGSDDEDDDSSIDWSKLLGSDEDDDDDSTDYFGGSNSNNSSNKNNSSSKVSSCRDAFDCLAKLDKGYSATEIDAITGIKGKANPEGSSNYEWEFPNGEKLQYYVSEYTLSIDVDYDKDNHKNSSVDLSGYKGIEDSIRAGTVKYKDLVKLFGAEGTAYQRSEYRTGYFWVDSKGGYIEASIDNDTQQVQSAFGILR